MGDIILGEIYSILLEIIVWGNLWNCGNFVLGVAEAVKINRRLFYHEYARLSRYLFSDGTLERYFLKPGPIDFGTKKEAFL